MMPALPFIADLMMYPANLLLIYTLCLEVYLAYRKIVRVLLLLGLAEVLVNRY